MLLSPGWRDTVPNFRLFLASVCRASSGSLHVFDAYKVLSSWERNVVTAVLVCTVVFLQKDPKRSFCLETVTWVLTYLWPDALFHPGAETQNCVWAIGLPVSASKGSPVVSFWTIFQSSCCPWTAPEALYGSSRQASTLCITNFFCQPCAFLRPEECLTLTFYRLCHSKNLIWGIILKSFGGECWEFNWVASNLPFSVGDF